MSSSLQNQNQIQNNHFSVIDIIMSLDNTLGIRIKGSNSILSEEDFLSMVFINGQPSVNSGISWTNDIRPKFTEIALNFLRENRDEKLKQTDQYSLPDFPHKSEEVKQAWLTYRQELRDLPVNSPDISIDLNTGELIGVTWPVPPS